MSYWYRGRHRAPAKSISRFVLPGLLVALLPISVAIGYLSPTIVPVTQISTVDPYAGSITIPAGPLAAPPATLSGLPHPVAIGGTHHTTHPNGSSYGPSESATESPLTTSTIPPTTEVPLQDQQAPPSSSEAPQAKDLSAIDPRCDSLNSEESVVRACNAIMTEFPEINSVIGQASRPGNPRSCHHRGLALDLMVSDNQLGDRIMEWVELHKEEFEIAWTGWEVPNHFDHVHLSFEPCKG